MHCPYCDSPNTKVTNTRLTMGNTQIWRRRRCLGCREIFTSHEIIDLSQLLVIKKSGRLQKFSRIKLYSGIYGATIGSALDNREQLVDKITREVEKQILALRQKKVSSQAVADMVLRTLRLYHPATFLRYLVYCKDIVSDSQMKREFHTYT